MTKHYEQRLIDMLVQIARRKEGEIYVVESGASWDVSSTPDAHNALIDRDCLEESITAHVDIMAATAKDH